MCTQWELRLLLQQGSWQPASKEVEDPPRRLMSSREIVYSPDAWESPKKTAGYLPNHSTASPIVGKTCLCN